MTDVLATFRDSQARLTWVAAQPHQSCIKRSHRASSMAALERYSIVHLQNFVPQRVFQGIDQRSRQWHAARAFRLTASDAPKVCGQFTGSLQEQHEALINHKVAIAAALNKGEAIPELAVNSRQRQALQWGTEHEIDGALPYAHALAAEQLRPDLHLLAEGQRLPPVPAGQQLTEIQGLLRLENCDMQVCGAQLANSFLLSVIACWHLYRPVSPLYWSVCRSLYITMHRCTQETHTLQPAVTDTPQLGGFHIISWRSSAQRASFCQMLCQSIHAHKS